MSELLVAQCPFCQTRFRLSHEHLQAAAGNVRCGACLKVFNASLTVTDSSESSPAQGPSSSDRVRTAKSAEQTDTLMIHDDMDMDDFDLESLGLDESLLEEINPAGRPADQAPDEPPAQAEFRLILEPESNDLAPEPEPQPEPEPEDEHRFDQGVDASPSAEDDGPGPWDSLDDADSDAAGDDILATEPDQNGEDDDFDLHDDFKATPTARDFAPETGRSDTNQLLTPVRVPPPEDNGIFLRDRPVGAAIPAQMPDEDHPPEEHDADPEQRREPELGALVALPDLVEEPLVLYEPARTRRSRFRPLWIALSLLALLGLPAQALYYNFSTLAHGGHSRPYLEKACFLLGCELPARVDITLIRSSNLMVRPHPEYPRALAIDVILYNRAEFAQPFPVLRMTFNNTRGQEVLSKQFRPDEYLAGELAGVTLMPPQTPVHVALDMLDPGPEAAGYQLDFLSP